MTSLKEAREARGIKQKAVAEAISVSRQTYAEYEMNPDKMSIATAKRVCDFIGCNVSEIFFGESV